jgi:hypothetical protein
VGAAASAGMLHFCPFFNFSLKSSLVVGVATATGGFRGICNTLYQHLRAPGVTLATIHICLLPAQHNFEMKTQTTHKTCAAAVQHPSLRHACSRLHICYQNRHTYASCPRRYVFEMIPDYARNVISGFATAIPSTSLLPASYLQLKTA